MFLAGEFTKASSRSKQRRLAVNAVGKDKLLAHIICLAIILGWSFILLEIPEKSESCLW